MQRHVYKLACVSFQTESMLSKIISRVKIKYNQNNFVIFAS